MNIELSNNLGMKMLKEFKYINMGLLFVLEGNVTLDDIIEANKKMVTHPNYNDIIFQIWDYRKVENVKVNTSDITTMVEKARQRRQELKPIKVAMVADKPFSYGISRMYAALSENSYWTFKICKTMAEAEEWVNS